MKPARPHPQTPAAPSAPGTAPASFLHLAQTAEAIGLQPKRLDKAASVAAYLAPLSDADLVWAARFLASHVFAGWDKRTLGVGTQALIAALAEFCAVPADRIKEALVLQGDLGLVAQGIWPAAADADAAPLTLVALAHHLEDLSLLRGTVRKRQALHALWRHRAPLEGNMLIKLMQGELRCGLKEGALEDAVARMAGVSVKSVQRANMLLGDIGETALRCRHHTLTDVSMRLFHGLKCMLASPADDAAHITAQMPKAFAAEDKYDGIRAQVHLAPASEVPPSARGARHGSTHVALFSRTQDDLTPSFVDLWSPLCALLDASAYKALVLDGEIIPVDGDAILPFARLQTRLGRKTPDAALQARVPVCFVAFDLLYAHETVLLDAPYTERRAQLAQLSFTAGTRLAPSLLLHDAQGLNQAFDAARARNNEGLVVKDLAAPYVPGRRGRQWLKLKRPLANLDVVVTAAEVGHGRRHKWLSDYTFAVRTSAEDATLLNIGKAYSGLTDAEIQRLTTWFRAHTRASFAHGKVLQVDPCVVLEVTFDKVQPSPRHKSGYALRFPRIVRLREDKPVEDIATLADVAALCEPSS